MAGIIHQSVAVGAGALHFRRLGRGRPVVLLHESPRSSLVLMPLAERLADRFTVFALDTPGYGLSDPLPLDRPQTGDFADAVASALRAAGLGRVPVYGTHTGATVAAALGARHPDLVSGIVFDGYPMFTQHERELHEEFYLPQFPPAWDGTHVARLWARVRDQYGFFPWYQRGRSARLSGERLPLERHRAVFRDFLRAGPSYATAYAASFRFDPHAHLAALTMPFHVIVRDFDVLRDHLDRLPQLPEGCTAARSPTDPDAWASQVAGLLDGMGGDVDAPALATLVEPAPAGRLAVEDGRLLYRVFGDRNAAREAVVLVHDTPGGALTLRDEGMREAGRGRLVLVPELPGHGVTDAFAGDPARELGSMIAEALSRFGFDTATIQGEGRGQDVAIAIARMTDALRPGEPLSGLPAMKPEDPRLPERWDGADLMARWYEVRARALAAADAGQTDEIIAGADIARLHRIFVASVLADGEDEAFQEAIRAGS
jgi:pimeloyl-ACP methyl ester carboxylesterase